MRSYQAARRAARQLEPIPFEVTYEAEVATEEGTELQERTEQFTLHGQVSSVTIADLGYFADVDAATPEGAGLIRRVFVEAFGNDAEFRRFWRVAGWLDDDTLVDIMGGVIEDTTGRPTTPSSDSPATSSPTGPGSKDGSPQQGSIHVAS